MWVWKGCTPPFTWRGMVGGAGQEDSCGACLVRWAWDNLLGQIGPLRFGFLCQAPTGPLPSQSLHHRKKTFLFAFFEIICPFLVVLGCLALQYPVWCVWGTQTNQRHCCSVILQISRSQSNPLSTFESNSHDCLMNDFQSISFDFQERSRGK